MTSLINDLPTGAHLNMDWRVMKAELELTEVRFLDSDIELTFVSSRVWMIIRDHKNSLLMKVVGDEVGDFNRPKKLTVTIGTDDDV